MTGCVQALIVLLVRLDWPANGELRKVQLHLGIFNLHHNRNVSTKSKQTPEKPQNLLRVVAESLCLLVQVIY